MEPPRFLDFILKMITFYTGKDIEIFQAVMMTRSWQDQGNNEVDYFSMKEFNISETTQSQSLLP